MTRIGIDIGGTFTDVVVDTGERLEIHKLSSTDDPADAFLAALEGCGYAGGADEVLHGTTVATNAVLQRRGARLAFLMTEGFRHILHLARQDRPSLYDVRASRPPPLVDEGLCVGVPERTGPHGERIVPLDRDELRRRLSVLSGRVDAVAVTLLHSYADPGPEREVREVVAEALPGVPVSLSSDVLPEFREYERASTTALNAFVQPVLARYLDRIGSRAGRGSLGVMWSGGGIRSARRTAERPVHTLLSGPAAGVLGAIHAAARAGSSELVTLDMGGTSADVALVEGGRPTVSSSAVLDGLPFATASIDLVSVGAGGGSIAWLDEGGALRVGPRSAGAVPGPAAYGRGGTEPTVSDAHVVAGHLSGGLAGGLLQLDASAAASAVRALAERAGLGLEACASGILTVVRSTMARAIRSVSVERGKDVRRFALVAFGGAGPLHGVELARELDVSRVLIPPSPGTLAALGLLVARRRAESARTHPVPADAADEIVRRLREAGEAAAAELGAEDVEPETITYHVDCRYHGQSHELRIDASPEAPELIASSFAEAHEARYGFRRSDAAVEVVTFRAVASGSGQRVADVGGSASTADPVRSRTIDGRDTPVYEREALPPDRTVTGPAIITELDATTWLPAGASATVLESSTLLVQP